MDIFDSPLGGAHLYRVEPDSFDRRRYIKTPQQASERWNTGTASAGPTWSQGIQQTTKPIVQAALNARGAMVANFQAATAPGGSWEKNLQAVGDAGIKAAAATAEPMYVAGTQRGQSKFATAIAKVIGAEERILPSIYSMASGTQAASEARMLSFSRQMHALKGTLGAR